MLGRLGHHPLLLPALNWWWEGEGSPGASRALYYLDTCWCQKTRTSATCGRGHEGTAPSHLVLGEGAGSTHFIDWQIEPQRGTVALQVTQQVGGRLRPRGPTVLAGPFLNHLISAAQQARPDWHAQKWFSPHWATLCGLASLGSAKALPGSCWLTPATAVRWDPPGT